MVHSNEWILHMSLPQVCKSICSHTRNAQQGSPNCCLLQQPVSSAAVTNEQGFEGL